MEIKSDLKNNYFKIYNESRGVVLNKSLVLKKKSARCLAYFDMMAMLLFWLLIMTVAVCFGVNRWLVFVLLAIDLVVLFVPIIRTIGNYRWKKANGFKNTVVIDKEGITDKSFKDIKITMGWNKIKAIVVKTYSITILTDTRIYFYFDVSDEDLILKECLKYIDKDLIIRK